MAELVSTPGSLVGRIIDGRYRLEARAGNGGQGDTYRARHIEHQRVVALKLLHERINGSDARRRSFEAEVAALSGLGHPSIASLVDYGVHEGQAWLAVQWLEGETVEQRLQRNALPLTAALAIVRQVLAALASAHAAKLVHRNLKPSNVFLERSPTQGRERVKLLDFTPLLRGVPAGVEAPYAPPELLRGEPLDARSDVYAVGATLIGMLSGGPDAVATDADPEDKPVSVPTRGRALPGVDATLLTWIRRATSPHKPLRFADGADALRELIDLLPRDLLSPPARVEAANRTAAFAVGRPPVPQPARPSAPNGRARRATPAKESSDAPAATRTSSGGLEAAAAAAGTRDRRVTPQAVSLETEVAARTSSDGLDAEGSQTPARRSTILPPPGDPADQVVPPPVDPPAADAAPSVDASPFFSPPDTGRGTLRPIESRLLSVASEPWRLQLMAAALFCVFLLSALALTFGSGRARSTREAERARAAQPQLEPVKTASTLAPAEASRLSVEPPAPNVVKLEPIHLAAVNPESEPEPEPEPPAVKRASPPQTARSSSSSIVAGAGRPKVRDPWQDPAPGELKRAHTLALNGAPGDEARIKALREYNRDHPDDVRGYLVIGQLYLNRLWRTDCVQEWGTALERDPTARGAPEILPALIDMVEQGKAPVLAERLIMKAYGREALEAIEQAFDDVKKPEAAARLHALRLHVTEGKPR